MNFSNFEKKMNLIGARVDSPICCEKHRICFDRAEGGYLYDSNGKRYIDMINGKGAVMLGHNDEDVNRAIISSVEQKNNIHTGPTQVITELSDILLRDCKLKDAKVTYFTTGTSACRAAVTLAQKYTGKHTIISAGYHGWDAMWESAKSFMKENDYGVVEFYFIPELLEKCIEMYSDIALIIISPDYVYLKKDTLQRIVKLAKENDILLCCDDVKQGYRYGEAISFGMLVAAEISNELGFLNNEEVEMHYELLKMIDVYKMFYLFKNCAMEEVINIMRYDNKRTKIENNKISLVLLKKLGECYSNDYASLLEIDEELIFDKMNYVMRKLSKYIN